MTGVQTCALPIWLRGGTCGAIASCTNMGKSRIVTRILTETSIKNGVRATLISTEMQRDEMQLQFVVCVNNNIIATHPDEIIEEGDIAKGLLSARQKQSLAKALDYVEEHSKIAFICTNIYDTATLKKLYKQEAMKGSKIIVTDVFKAQRNSGAEKGLSEWQALSLSAEILKQMSIELNICVLFTLQLNSSVLQTGELNYASLALATHIAFVLDYLFAFREITWQEKTKNQIKLHKADGVFNGELCDFDKNKSYFLCKLIKNRAGQNGVETIMEADRGRLLFSELGYLSRGNKNSEE